MRTSPGASAGRRPAEIDRLRLGGAIDEVAEHATGPGQKGLRLHRHGGLCRLYSTKVALRAEAPCPVSKRNRAV